MARVLLTSAYPPESHPQLTLMRRAAAIDRFGVHTLVDTPENADVILFVEVGGGTRYYDRVRRDPVFRGHREKSFIYTTIDTFIAFVPGLYVNAERRYAPRARVRSSSYLQLFEWDFLGEPAPEPRDRRHLASFVGSFRTHAVRPRLATLPGRDIHVVDTSAFAPYGVNMTPGELSQLQRSYVESIHESHFVLAPRGEATGSYRCFEAMRLARPPVIIADDWVEPDGPDWSTFSVRVRERDVTDIPDILADLRPRSIEMGRAARAAYETWFSPEVMFHHSVEACLDMISTRPMPEAVLRWTPWWQLLRPVHLRRYVISRMVGRLGPD